MFKRKDKYGIDSFMDILDYLFEMWSRGNIKEEMLFLVKEAYYFTHGEPEEEAE